MSPSLRGRRTLDLPVPSHPPAEWPISVHIQPDPPTTPTSTHFHKPHASKRPVPPPSQLIATSGFMAERPSHLSNTAARTNHLCTVFHGRSHARAVRRSPSTPIRGLSTRRSTGVGGGHLHVVATQLENNRRQDEDGSQPEEVRRRLANQKAGET